MHCPDQTLKGFEDEGPFDLVQVCAACPTVLFSELDATRHVRSTGHRVMGRLQFKKVLMPIEDLT